VQRQATLEILQGPTVTKNRIFLTGDENSLFASLDISVLGQEPVGGRAGIADGPVERHSPAVFM